MRALLAAPSDSHRRSVVHALALVSILGLTPLVALAQDDDVVPLEPAATPLEAAAWLDATWAALGAPEALEALGVVRMQGHVQALTSDFKGPFEELYHPDGRALQRIDFEGSDPVFFGVDGRVSWEAWSDQGVAKFDWHAASDWRRFFLHRHAGTPGRTAPGATAPWRALYRDVAIGGRAKVEGQDCVRLVLTPRPAREHGLAEVAQRRQPEPDILWIAEATRLPVRIEMEMLRPAEGEVRLKETFSDWREHEGVRFPMRRKLEVPGAGLEFTVATVELSAEVASAAFDLPETLAATVAESYPSAIRLPDNGWQVVERPATTTVVWRATCSPADENVHIGTVQGELLGLLAELGVAPAGTPYLRNLARSTSSTFELAVPVATRPTIPASHAERVSVVEVPGGLYVEGTHRGARARIDESLMRLDHYLRTSRLVGAGSVHEALLVPADAEDDPTAWHTILAQPVSPRTE
jgi:hypothetical protein